MIYTFFLIDKPGASELRDRIRPEHRDYLSRVADRMAFAGPLVSDDGQAICGSLLAIDFASREDAAAWIADEPFTKAGLYASTAIYGFRNLYPQKAGFPPA